MAGSYKEVFEYTKGLLLVPNPEQSLVSSLF